MKYAVAWSEAARGDLLGIVDRIAAESPLNAGRILERLEDRAAGLHRFPRRGRLVPELQDQGISAVRELIEAPWRIVYKLEGRRVLVIGVFDGRRQLLDVLLERFLRA